jgi:hypothetical protein
MLISKFQSADPKQISLKINKTSFGSVAPVAQANKH